ncbi:isoprenylcysteine carboxyl methyltransferase family protein [Streptomyces longwoodensis]|uniref:isoprenylcysteine carboxyl methyltransferase family protein n=1 Tax=Streptomyces longwoodensis TaxID=68231 RepID=UPI00381B6782
MIHLEPAFPGWLLVLLPLMTAERLLEVVVARRNTRWARARGAVESGRGHYPVMVVLHVAFLAGIVVEITVSRPPFHPLLAGTAVATVVAANVVRAWCMRALGPQWNTRVIVVPGMPLVTHGPYRRLRHPNYAIVVAEGIALPLVYGTWTTALLFTVANAALLSVRLRTENAALRQASAVSSPDGQRTVTTPLAPRPVAPGRLP